MDADLEEFDRLRRAVEETRRRADRDAGQLEQLLAQLKAEHGADSLVAGRKLLQLLTEDEQALMRAYRRGLAAFKVEHGDKLG